MNSFWNRLYDQAKDRRYAALFMVTLAGFVGLIVLGVLLGVLARAFNEQIQFADVLPGVGIFAVALVWRTIRRLRARRRDRLTFSPLSRDELRKARSKLRKGKSVEKV